MMMDVLLVYYIPKSVVPSRASVRRSGKGGDVRETDETAQSLVPAFIKWLPKRQCSYLSQSKLWMRLEISARTFPGGEDCAVSAR